MKYREARDTVLQELQTVFTYVKEDEVVALAEAICEAETVFVVGVCLLYTSVSGGFHTLSQEPGYIRSGPGSLPG